MDFFDNRYILCALAAIFTMMGKANGQLTIGGQLRVRAELRAGQGQPLSKDSGAGFFISQRTRVNLGYKSPRLSVGITVQDVRVWGQDASTVNRYAAPGLDGVMVHEAWAQVNLLDTTQQEMDLQVKFGRQELNYDDARLLGNLDWLQQARRHDAVKLMYGKKNTILHLGLAYNQNKEVSSATPYNNTPPAAYPGNTNASAQYKSMEYLYAAQKFKGGYVSALFLADQFAKFTMVDNSGTLVKKPQQGAWNRMTTGLYFTHKAGRHLYSASGYYQWGSSPLGVKMNGALLSGSAMWGLAKTFSAGPGLDYTTGGAKEGKSKAFDPLYGTPHKFWGLMDYYYVANGFGRNGLANAYLKSKWAIGKQFNLMADVHHFRLSNELKDVNGDKLDAGLGYELDLHFMALAGKHLQLEGGYSLYHSTETLISPQVKNVPNARALNQWAWFMAGVKF